MKREYILESLTEYLLTEVNNDANPYKTVKKYLNMALDIGSNHIKFSQINQPKTKPVIQLTMLGKELKPFMSISEASNITGIDKGNIAKACNENNTRVLSAGGFKWKYKKTTK